MERIAGEELGRGAACEEGGGAGQQEGGVPMGTGRQSVVSDAGHEGGVPMGRRRVAFQLKKSQLGGAGADQEGGVPMGGRSGGSGAGIGLDWVWDWRLYRHHQQKISQLSQEAQEYYLSLISRVSSLMPLSSLPLSDPQRHSEKLSDTHGSDKEDEVVDSSDDDCDPYFNCLVDSFITATKAQPKQLYGNIDLVAAAQRQSNEYASSALDYYNKDENNKGEKYGHVNFIASLDSKEELFFAEVCWDPKTYDMVPTCIESLEEKRRIGGRSFINDEYVVCLDLQNPPIDGKHCYGCSEEIKHPEDGSTFKAGHVAATGFYDSFM
uniref:DUF3615 domain-containing protein n=1 Tax=Oryza barthii TaxID=65489 RepID=A0A0D3GAD5_9ORYZ